MLSKGKWMSEKGSKGHPHEIGDVELPSFQISSLYSPLGFFSWRDAVKEWFEYLEKKDPALLQVFINQTLGESFSVSGQDISSNWMYERREEYAADLPAGVLVLTAGVDVQDNRLELEIVGHGLSSETWSIDYVVIPGNPDFLGDEWGLDYEGNPTVWKLLDDYLQASYQLEVGGELHVECALIDAGHKTEIVNNFCKCRHHRRVFPIHGKDGWGKGYIKRPNKPHEKYGTMNYTLWVDELKVRTYSLLRNDKPGPGYCHFPKRDNYDHKHFKQLTAEHKEVQHIGGKKKLKWVLPSGARNEQLDCRNYASAALQVYSPNLEFRAEQYGAEAVGVPVEQAIGAEGNNLHMENRALENNPRSLKPQPLPRKKRRNGKKGSKGVW
jgi:phage terminase large subunit GpA-like protein